ncbi:hypothetical protein SUNI508_10111 [Seiridium unicorne]|uniref:N-acetyltransferase domain-containing protein n=1 Tax=Seiridium unicorne TaxID=138068 RepID=A0ABR2UNE1_9PEZI
MESRFFISLLFMLWSNLPASLAQLSSQQPLGAVPFEFREPRFQDAADLATTLFDAFSSAPAWKYLHQFQDEHPGYQWECSRKSLEDFFRHRPSNAPIVRVISVPDQTSESGSRVVSFSIWQFNKTRETIGSPAHLMFLDSGNCSQRLDVNKTRAEDYAKQMADMEKTYLDDVYEQQVYLGLLATHPKWDGNGFAAVHLHWGMALADNMGLPTTLIATPAGYPLYKSIGFEDIYNGTITRLDGLGVFWHEAMIYSA